MGCLQSKTNIMQVQARRTTESSRSSNGFANKAGGETPKSKKSSRRYISPASSIEAIDRIRMLPRPDSRRSRRSGQTPHPEPTMPPTPDSEKRTYVVQYAEDLEPADEVVKPDEHTPGTRRNQKSSKASVSNVNLNPLSDDLLPSQVNRFTALSDESLQVEDLDSDMDVVYGHLSQPQNSPVEAESAQPYTAPLLLRQMQPPGPDYIPPHHQSLNPRHKLEHMMKPEQRDDKQSHAKSSSANMKSGSVVKDENAVKRPEASVVLDHKLEVMFLDDIQQEGIGAETPKTPVVTPKSPLDYMFTVPTPQIPSETPPRKQQPLATSSKETFEAPTEEQSRKDLDYMTPRYLTPSPLNKFENKATIAHFLGKQDPRSPRRLVLSQKNKVPVVVTKQRADVSVRNQNWTSPRDDKSENSEEKEGFLTHDAFECVEKVIDIENQYSTEDKAHTFANDRKDIDNDESLSPERKQITHMFMPTNISEMKVKKERLKRKRKRSGRKHADPQNTPANHYDDDTYLQDISSLSGGFDSRRGSLASTNTIGSAASHGTIQSFIKPGFTARPISGHSRASGQSRADTPFHSDAVQSTLNTKRLHIKNKPGKREGVLNFREISRAPSSNQDTNAQPPEANVTTKYSYSSGMTQITGTRENSADFMSQTSVDSLDISGSTTEFSQLPAKFQDVYQAVDDTPISPKRHYLVGSDSADISVDSCGLCVEDFEVHSEQHSGSSSSMYSTKQKLLYSKYARSTSTRPKSDTIYGTGGRPPLPPGRPRPHSEYTKPLSFSKYFLNDTDLI